MPSDAELTMAALRVKHRLTGLLDSLNPDDPAYLPDYTNPDTVKALHRREYQRRVERSISRSRSQEGPASGDGAPLSEWDEVIW
jgi:hypothetical protein